MKQIYVALAAAVCAGSALAGVNPRSLETATRNLEFGEVENFTKAESSKGMFKAPATAENTNGWYIYEWVGRTSQDQGWNETGMQIEVAANGTDCTLYGIFYDYPVAATFNAAEGWIRVASQQLLPASQWNGTDALMLYTETFDVDSNNQITNTRDIPFIQFDFCPDGVEMQSGGVAYVGAWLAMNMYDQFEINIAANHLGNSGYVGSWKYGNRISVISETYELADYYKVNLDEWESLGNAKLDDGWFRALDGKGYPAYDVACYQNKTNKGLILLENPYGVNSPYASINTAKNGTGYIMLDVTNPDCVLVLPFVNASFIATDIVGEYDQTCCTNKEGMMAIVEGYTTEEIVEEAEAFGDPISTMTESGIITIPNARVQFAYNPQIAQQWINSDKQPIAMESQIILPDGGGVEGILNEGNTAARYFNLQGVEISNPEAGQVVIVKEGNKASKVIR